MTAETRQNDLMTAEPEEIARFAAMADEWWDPHGKFRPLHKINPTRLQFIRDHLVEHFERDPQSAQPLAGASALSERECGKALR